MIPTLIKCFLDIGCVIGLAVLFNNFISKK